MSAWAKTKSGTTIKPVKAILPGKEGRVWFLAEDDEVWLSDPRNTTGTNGDVVRFGFRDSELLPVSVKGPWLSTRTMMELDTEVPAKFPKGGTPKTLREAIDLGLTAVGFAPGPPLASAIEAAVSDFVAQHFTVAMMYPDGALSDDGRLRDLFARITGRKGGTP